MYKELIKHLGQGKTLHKKDIHSFLKSVVDGELSEVQQATVLSALNTKGISAKELEAFVRFLSQEMPDRVRFSDALDICGTGGSGLQRINTSTISAFILSALGVRVAKHGNKAASGRFGSFDLLEKLGIAIDADASLLEKLAERHHLALIYARQFHPIMKHFGKVRKSMGVPTVFNLIGPLLNPAGTSTQMIGTGFSDSLELIAETAKKLGKKRVMVVHGSDGLDEITITGKTFVVELNDGVIQKKTLTPKQFGISACRFQDIQGGSASVNTSIAVSILKGTCSTRHLDLVLVNTAAALKLAGKVKSYKKGYQMAKQCVESGAAYQQYLMYRQSSHTPSILIDITEQKATEVAARKKKISLARIKKSLKPSERNFKEALQHRGLSLIAEIKKASPSEGPLKRGTFDVSRLAKTYESSGARAISVLTDQSFFKGSFENLKKAAKAIRHTPLLCKDFIIDEYQIYEARKYGADAILLIVAILSDQQLKAFFSIARSLEMDCLVEVHTEEELKRAQALKADIIGINNRDLHTFVIEMKTTKVLSKKIRDAVIVSESGLHSKKDLSQLPKKVDAVLIGTALMKSSDPAKKITSLFGAPAPLVKICGVQSVSEALLCQRLRVDMIGLNFVPTSRRRLSYQTAGKIVSALRKKGGPTRVVGVFMDQPEDEVFTVAKKLGLDMIQLHGEESLQYVKKSPLPVIKAFSVEGKKSLQQAKKYRKHVAHLLLDGRQPGSGDPFPYQLLKGFHEPFLLAGGINKTNALAALKKTGAIGIDVASGVESNWKRDKNKMRDLLTLFPTS